MPGSLAKVLDWLSRQPYKSEVLVVDDGSDDNTAGVVRHLITQQDESEGETKAVLRLIANEHRGKGYTVRSGMLGGQGKYILFSDVDLSVPIEEVDKLLSPLQQGNDLAIGSREGQGARRYNEPFYRHLMGRVFNLLVRTVTRSPYQDTQCGFKAFTREAAYDLFENVQLYGENSRQVRGPMFTAFDVEILFLAAKRGYRVAEVPVQWYHGEGSKISPVKDSVRMASDILKVRFNDLRGLYKEYGRKK